MSATTKSSESAVTTTSTTKLSRRHSVSSRLKTNTKDSKTTSGTMSPRRNNNATRRSAKHAKRSAERSNDKRNSNGTSTENKRLPRCNRSVVRLKNAERLRKPRSKPPKKKQIELLKRHAKMKKRLKPKSQRPIKRMKVKMLITKKSPKPKLQPGRNARKESQERREDLKKIRTEKTPAVVEVVVRKRLLAPSRCGRLSPRKIPRPNPRKLKKS